MQITDAAVLRAVAHPLRRRLMDVLRVQGPQTASLLAAATGEGVGNISHHVRVLADAGLLQEAPELARDRRERWWRMAQIGLSFAEADFEGDPAGEAAASAATSLALQRQLDLVRQWLSSPQETPWLEAAFSTDYWLRLTPDELAQLSTEVNAVIAAWQEREVPDDGQQRPPVFVLARGFPATP